MRRSEIRTHVASKLAEMGYPTTNYAWPTRSAVCHIAGKQGMYYLYAPSGISRKLLNEQIGRLPIIGSYRPLPTHMKTDKPTQSDMWDNLSCDGRRD